LATTFAGDPCEFPTGRKFTSNYFYIFLPAGNSGAGVRHRVGARASCPLWHGRPPRRSERRGGVDAGVVLRRQRRSGADNHHRAERCSAQGRASPAPTRPVWLRLGHVRSRRRSAGILPALSSLENRFCRQKRGSSLKSRVLTWFVTPKPRFSSQLGAIAHDWL